MSSRTAFLHIGLPKTGTTSIQAACDTERAVLAAQGFHYLSGDRNHSEWLSLAFWDAEDAVQLAGYRWKDGPEAVAYCRERRKTLGAEIEDATGHLVLSAEGLSMFEEREIAALRDALAPHVDRFRIIAYLRDPLSWATSAAQQAVKWSGSSLDDLFDSPRLPEFATRITPWLNVFGPEAMDFRAYGAGEVVADFSAAIGLETPLAHGARMNAALSHRSVIALSQINALRPPFIDARHNPFRSFDLVRDSHLPGQRFTLPRETVEAHKDAIALERD